MTGKAIDVSHWFTADSTTETEGVGVARDLSIVMPNSPLAAKVKEEEEKKRRQEALNSIPPGGIPNVPTATSADVPSFEEAYGDDFAPTGGEGVTLGEDIAYRVSPFVNPVMEVIDAINNTVYGTAFDLLRVATWAGTTVTGNAQEIIESAITGDEYEYQPGVVLDTPDILKNKSFVDDPEMEAFLDKGGYYAGLGMNINAASRALVNNLGRGMQRWSKSGSRLDPKTGKPFLGTESVSQGITRSISQSSMPTETKIGLAMAAGGEIAKELSGSESPVIGFVGELAAGLASAASPAKYMDTATGIVRFAETGAEIPAKTILDEYEKKYGRDAINMAKRRARGSTESPVEAKQTLEAPDIRFAPATQTGDAGLLTLERSLARADKMFQGHVDEQIDHAQYSLAKELEALIDPQTGTYNWQALSDFLAKNSDELVAQVDDRVIAAQQELAGLLKVYDGDVTKMSKEFSRVYDEMVVDIKAQENNYWEPIVNSGYQLETAGFQEAIKQIILNANSQTKLPMKEFAEYIGMGIQRTGKGFKLVPLNMQGDKSLKNAEVVFPKKGVYLQPKESPSVLKTIRTNLNELVRDPNRDVTAEVAIQAQDAAVKALEGSVDSAPTGIRDAYRAATNYSRKVHETLKGDKSIFPKVTKALEQKRLETLMQGKTQTDMSVISDYLGKFYGLTTPNSAEAQSKSLKLAESMLMAKFQTQVDPTDLASFDAFISAHRDWFVRFPESAKVIKAARAKAARLGRTIKNRELKAEQAKNDAFVQVAGMNPNQVMDTILSSPNPNQMAARFKRLFSGKDNKQVMETFREGIARRLLDSTMKNIEARVSGRGTMEVVDPVKYRQTLKQLDPLLKVFKVKEYPGLQMLEKDLKRVEKALSAKGSIDGEELNVGISLLAKVGTYRLINEIFGASSLVVGGTASNFVTKKIQNANQGVANAIIIDGLKNPELMKILLSPEITETQIAALRAGKFATGRVLFKLLSEKTEDEITRQTEGE